MNEPPRADSAPPDPAIRAAEVRDVVSHLLTEEGWGAFILPQGRTAPDTKGGHKRAVSGSDGLALFTSALAAKSTYGLRPSKAWAVLDFDSERAWMAFKAGQWGDLAEKGLVVKTPGGWHLLLRQPEPPLPQFAGNRKTFGPSIEKQREGKPPYHTNEVDCRTHNGFVVGMGSIRCDPEKGDTEGIEYVILSRPADWKSARIPDEMGKDIERKFSRTDGWDGQDKRKSQTLLPRHEQLKAHVFELWRKGDNREVALASARQFNENTLSKHPSGPMEADRLDDEFEGLWKYAAERLPQSPVLDHLSYARHYRNKRLKPHGGALLRIPKDAGDHFAFFTGTGNGDTDSPQREGYWKMVAEASVQDDLARFIERTRNAAGITKPLWRGLVRETLAAILDHYEAEILRHLSPAVPEIPWDHRETVFAFPDGTVFDFAEDKTKAMKFRPSRYDDLSLTQCAVTPKKGKTPCYDEFMKEITCERKDLAEDLEGIAAICLLKRTRQRLMFFTGEGSNGKGTLIHLWGGLLGGYFHLIPEGWRGNTTFWQASLEGKSLVCFDDTAETKAGSIPWPMLKALSGGRKITAAHKGRKERTFDNHSTLVFLVNRLPKSDTKDAAKERRVICFPFEFDIRSKEGGEDEGLDAKLAAEYPGILYRFMERAREVMRSGQFDPMPEEMGETVRSATSEAWKTIALVSRFFASDAVEFEKEGKIPRSKLWLAYSEWCQNNNERPRKHEFYKELPKIVGIEVKRDGLMGMVVKGIKNPGGSVLDSEPPSDPFGPKRAGDEQ